MQMLGLTIPIDQLVIIAMLIFARVGACLMLMPGISSARIPMNLRLFLAVAISLVMLPLAAPNLQLMAENPTIPELFAAIISESLIGALFGIIAQVYFWGLQFMGNVIAMSMNFSGQPGSSTTESMPETPIANIISLAALMLFFATDLHLVVVRGLIASYQIVPASFIPHPDSALIDYRDALSKSFITTMRIASPFLLYSILVNIAVGLINKLTPTIPIFFVSMPFVLGGGLLLLYFLLPEMLKYFGGELAAWLERGP